MFDTENANCNFCKSHNYRAVYSEGTLKLVKCSACGFYYVNPRIKKKQLLDHYDDKFRIGTEQARRKLKNASEDQVVVTDISDWPERRLRKLRQWLEDDVSLIMKYKKRGRLLDVGFGDGTRLKYAFDRRWKDIYGLELSDAAVKKAKGMFDLRDGDKRFYNSTIADADFPPEHFDVITYWSVLEHVVDPLENMQRACVLLKKGGIIVIRVPNVREELFRKYAGNIARFILPRPIKRLCGFRDLRPITFGEMLDLTRNASGATGGPELALHVNHFSDRTLGMLLEKCGFKVLENRNGEGPRSIEHNIKFLAKNMIGYAAKIPYYLALRKRFNFSRTLLFVAQKV